jgi:hypothetical protein
MLRVEERVREAAAKEASAKKWNKEAIEAEEWRSHREVKERETDRAIRVIEEELEEAKLKVWRLLTFFMWAPPPHACQMDRCRLLCTCRSAP